MTPWMYAAAIIACGVGAAARYALSLARGPHQLPWPTFAANIIGTIVLGAAAAAVDGGAPDWVLLVLGAGLAGGLTTFSTLALDAVTLWGAGRRSIAVGYLLATAVVGIGAAALGWVLGLALS
jgi:CrcB protein